MNNKSEVIFILDKSGSMYDMVEDAIGGYNRLIDDLKESNASINITTILFSSDMEYLCQNQDIKEVKHLSKKDYKTGGMTALYDAVGNAIENLSDSILDDTPVSFFITTDGEENSSNSYTKEMIRKMIKWHTKYENWKFSFLAQGIDTEEVSVEMGIDENRCFSCADADELYDVMEDLVFDDLEEEII